MIFNGNMKFSYNEFEITKDTLHYVMWSGGADSTLLLYQLLDEYGADKVIAISYKYSWLFKTKYDSEKLHREAFKAKMKLLGDKYSNFKHIEFDISKNIISGDDIRPSWKGLAQSAAWLLTIPLYIDNNSYVYDGAVKEDDLTVYLEDYNNLFVSASRLIGKNLCLKQPYIYTRKSSVIRELIKLNLYDLIWFCELPNDVNVSCCKCNSCIEHIGALTQLLYTTDDPIIKEKVKRELDSLEVLKKKDDKKSKDKSSIEIKD